jgi:hypothetical protein
VGDSTHTRIYGVNNKIIIKIISKHGEWFISSFIVQQHNLSHIGLVRRFFIWVGSEVLKVAAMGCDAM